MNSQLSASKHTANKGERERALADSPAAVHISGALSEVNNPIRAYIYIHTRGAAAPFSALARERDINFVYREKPRSLRFRLYTGFAFWYLSRILTVMESAIFSLDLRDYRGIDSNDVRYIARLSVNRWDAGAGVARNVCMHQRYSALYGRRFTK